jgi:hypothetical protein
MNGNKKAKKLPRIATTGDISNLWGDDSEMRERFESEAKEQQESYRAQNETWRTAERFLGAGTRKAQAPAGAQAGAAKKPRRPPNGYNLFLKQCGSKVKDRDRVWEVYSRAMNGNKKAKKLPRIATTGDISRLWGAKSEMRERFEREAKEQQELYSAQNEPWRTADRLQACLSTFRHEGKTRESSLTATALVYAAGAYAPPKAPVRPVVTTNPAEAMAPGMFSPPLAAYGGAPPAHANHPPHAGALTYDQLLAKNYELEAALRDVRAKRAGGASANTGCGAGADPNLICAATSMTTPAILDEMFRFQVERQRLQAANLAAVPQLFLPQRNAGPFLALQQAQVPSGWKMAWDPVWTRPYFYNTVTGVVTWDPPPGPPHPPPPHILVNPQVLPWQICCRRRKHKVRRSICLG